jgi:two-component system, OmpR family, response regulator RstA
MDGDMEETMQPAKIEIVRDEAMAESGAERKIIYLLSGWKETDRSIVGYLRGKNFGVEIIVGWQEANFPLPQKKADLVLLDFNLKDPGAFASLVKIRESFRGPLVVVSGKVEENLHVMALELGADDFIELPVSPALICARVRALIRQASRCAEVPENIIAIGDLAIDAGRREVSLRGRIIELTTLEFDLLWYLAHNAGSVVSRNDIHMTIYNREYNGMDRSIDMYISRLRQKLGDDQSSPRLLKTVRGTGYLLSRRLPSRISTVT